MVTVLSRFGLLIMLLVRPSKDCPIDMWRCERSSGIFSVTLLLSRSWPDLSRYRLGEGTFEVKGVASREGFKLEDANLRRGRADDPNVLFSEA